MRSGPNIKLWPTLNHFNSDTFTCAPFDGVARGFNRLLIILKEILLVFCESEHILFVCHLASVRSEL